MLKIFSLISITLILILSCSNIDTSKNIDDILSELIEIDNWQAVDTMETYVGKDLYLLINGGAEIYHTNGFVRAVSRSFKNPEGNEIAVELYQMNSALGSKAVFDIKVAENGIDLPYGDKAVLNGYYLNLYKDKYLLTLVGFDDSENTVAGLELFARQISGKL